MYSTYKFQYRILFLSEKVIDNIPLIIIVLITCSIHIFNIHVRVNKHIIKIDFICFFYFYNAATRKFESIYVSPFIFPTGSFDVDFKTKNIVRKKIWLLYNG